MPAKREVSNEFNSNELEVICRKLWKSIFNRCYGKIQLPTYIGCSVSQEWHTYSIFRTWFKDNYIKGFDLDKDLLRQGNKVYSKDTCCFIPPLLNATLSLKPSNSNLPYGVGIRQYKGNVSYIARICIKGERQYLGIFATPKEAKTCYDKARREYLNNLAEEYKGIIVDKAYKAIKDLSGYNVTPKQH